MQTPTIDVNGLVSQVDVARRTAAGSKSRNDQVQAAIAAALEKLGSMVVTDNDVQFTGDKIVLPAAYEDRPEEAIDFLVGWKKSQDKTTNFTRQFQFRPWDGAAAFERTMFKIFGTVGIGAVTQTIFGEQPPQKHTINTGVSTTMQVPWGKVDFPLLGATFTLGAVDSRDHGALFVLSATAPKRNERKLNAFFDMLAKELFENSIYKGKAIDGGEMPNFLDLDRLDTATVVYTDEVLGLLETNVWSLLKYADAYREAGLPLKRAFLLEGPYGTGKSLAGLLTAKHAVDNGFTYILCRPGVDNLRDVLKTAALYAPAVVWFEDIDTIASGGTAGEISELLDLLDGIASKGAEVIAGFTTNHVEAIQRAVMRPGRLDAVIHVGALDEAGIQRLVEAILPKPLRGKIDFKHVGNAFAGFLPAFAAEAIRSAVRYSIARNQGKPGLITTSDLADAALSLRRQLDLMQGAAVGANAPTLDSVFRGTVADVLNHTRVGYNGDDEVLSHEPKVPVAIPAG